MFGKRKSQRPATQQWQEPTATPTPGGHEDEAAAGTSSEAQPARPAPKPDASAVLNRQPTPPVRPEQVRRGAGNGPARPGSAPRGEAAESKKLIVGRDIALSGEIRSCEKLVVEGTVEAQINDTRHLEIAPSGLYKGSATVDVAEVAGRFEGELTVRQRLYVKATGQVGGTIRYRGLEIESGGRIGGQLVELSEDDLQNLRGGGATRPASEPAPSEDPQASQPNGAAGPAEVSGGQMPRPAGGGQGPSTGTQG